MIPKIIHFCWFGDKEFPPEVINCMDSWKKKLPDYQVKMWNEDNFDCTIFKYCEEAYSAKKYAFVSDVCRLYALYNEGGIYLDTDVEVLKSFDDLLNLPGFICYENSARKDVMSVASAVIGAEKGNLWVKEQLDLYKHRRFFKFAGKMDMTPNPITMVNKMLEEGFVFNFNYPRTVYKNSMVVFPPEWFSPYFTSEWLNVTENTYCIHHYFGSWIEPLNGGGAGL